MEFPFEETQSHSISRNCWGEAVHIWIVFLCEPSGRTFWELLYCHTDIGHPRTPVSTCLNSTVLQGPFINVCCNEVKRRTSTIEMTARIQCQSFISFINKRTHSWTLFWWFWAQNLSLRWIIESAILIWEQWNRNLWHWLNLRIVSVHDVVAVSLLDRADTWIFLNHPSLNLRIIFYIGSYQTLFNVMNWTLSLKCTNCIPLLQFGQYFRSGLSVMWNHRKNSWTWIFAVFCPVNYS